MFGKTNDRAHRGLSAGFLTALGLLMAAFLAPGGAVAAPAGQSIEAIEQTVRDFLRAQGEKEPGEWDIRVHRLDRRLRLHACRTPLEAFAPHGRVELSGRTTVGVRCNDTKRWKLYVPVSIDRFMEVVVTRHPLSSGQRISAADLTMARKNTARLPYGYYERIEPVVGQAVRQPLAAGDVVRPATLAEPTLVQRGQELILVADTGSVQVSMSGVALENGARGERIRVRNTRSGRTVEGTVLDSHRVNVGTVSAPMAGR
ncbi:flagellar basal body P-ring formation protein FlgA [Ectothiorhodospiraceae bacterium WFHF3C12]|nr:flagellar basal body P-ring formation protein FlgA [Ectothiorhodospiraceae bacterium WFHF3C12]